MKPVIPDGFHLRFASWSVTPRRKAVLVIDDSTLRRLAADQHGLVSVEQARAAGFREASLRRLTDGARWERTAPRVIRLLGSTPTLAHQLMAAVLDAGPGGRAPRKPPRLGGASPGIGSSHCTWFESGVTSIVPTRPAAARARAAARAPHRAARGSANGRPGACAVRDRGHAATWGRDPGLGGAHGADGRRCMVDAARQRRHPPQHAGRPCSAGATGHPCDAADPGRAPAVRAASQQPRVPIRTGHARRRLAGHASAGEQRQR